ncbi:VOC family protein [Cohnella abietis]|uniref:Fosmidomycin resistance protein n=1 Tax=Cohnella abietis TaxID=2507935 RepID=A0A3T1D775_9BACL|nr:VOC family protein [Cohnella abietis]BBI33924.1 fosmidomycin resistance protein [Cohnella abietis]
MIKGLFETHLLVRDLDNSISFYETLGLKLGVRYDNVAFFWITEDKQHMLGLWQTSEEKMQKRHFAFNVSVDDLINSPQYLFERNISLKPVFGRGTDEPIVHSWMPAAAVYFDDPDGNELEFIAMLGDKPKQLSYVPYLSEWNAEISKG